MIFGSRGNVQIANDVIKNGNGCLSFGCAIQGQSVVKI